MRKFLVAALVVGTLFPVHVFAADGSTMIPANGSHIETTNFYQVRMETFTVPTATSLISAVSGNKVFIGDRPSRTIWLASLGKSAITLERTITVPEPLNKYHKSNSIIDMLATKTDLFVIAVDGVDSSSTACGGAKIYDFSIANLDAKPKLLFTSSPCVHGEIFWDARLAINGDTLYIAGGNALAKNDDGTFPGPDSQDFIEGDKFPITNYFGAVSAINIKTKKSTLIATGLRHLGGMYYDATRKVLWESENGPRGGDELNIIVKGKNYGWPQVTLGRPYEFLESPKGVKSNSIGKSEAPIYSWTPSISPSTVRRVPTTGEFSKYWNGDLLVGSLKGKQIRRLRISAKNTVMYDEPIYVGNRIRSFDILSDGRLLCATDEGTIVLLSDTQLVGTGEFPAKS